MLTLPLNRPKIINRKDLLPGIFWLMIKAKQGRIWPIVSLILEKHCY